MGMLDASVSARISDISFLQELRLHIAMQIKKREGVIECFGNKF
jgi:hypothetical protein